MSTTTGTLHPLGIFDFLTADAVRDLHAVEHLAATGAAAGGSATDGSSAAYKADAAAALAPSQAGVAVWEALGGVGGSVTAPLAAAASAQAAAAWGAAHTACPALARSLERAAGGAATLHPINAAVLAAAAGATMLATYARYGECSVGFYIDAALLALASWVVGVYAPRRWVRSAAAEAGALQSVYTRWVVELADAWVVFLVLGVWATFLPPAVAVAFLVLYNARLSLPLLAGTRAGAAARAHIPANVAAVALPLLSTSFGVFVATVGAGAALGYVGVARGMDDAVNSLVLLLAALSVVARPGMALRAVYAVARRDVDPLSHVVSRHVVTAWPARDSECMLRFTPAAVQAAMPPHVAAAALVLAVVAAAEARPDLFLHAKLVSAVTLVLVRRVLVPAVLAHAFGLLAAHSVALDTPLMRTTGAVATTPSVAADTAAAGTMAATPLPAASTPTTIDEAALLERLRAQVVAQLLRDATAAEAASPPTAAPVAAAPPTSFAAALAGHLFASK